MVRPCFVVVDPEYGSNISTRKLVIETAKLNVLTAYSAEELIETIHAYPRVNGVVLNSNMRDISCAEAVRSIKQVRSDLPVIVVGTAQSWECEGADYTIETYDPQRLLDVLKAIEPRQIEIIRQRDEDLNRHPPED